MNITFEPLHESHFSLLLKWLENSHVKKWWDQDITYTMDQVRNKYTTYVKGYKLINGVQKAIRSFIICIDKVPVGYIQMYDVYDFPQSVPLIGLPQNVGGVDILIGEEEYLGRGNGSIILKQFLETYVFANYRYAFADPEFRNETAVKAYEKAGFVPWKRVGKKLYMVAHKKIVRLSISDMIALEVTFKRVFLPEDSLWLFGSRADLSQKGGDIDLYVETYAHTVDEAAKMRDEFIYSLEQEIGEQKIDLVLNMINHPYPLPIHQVALAEGVRII